MTIFLKEKALTFACFFIDQQEYFEHSNRFLLLLEPIIEDLARKNLILSTFQVLSK